MKLLHSVVVRVTAATDSERSFWFDSIAAVAVDVAGGATLDKSALGAWSGERGLEVEPSWSVTVFTNDLAALLTALAPAVHNWLEACNQEAAFLVVDGVGWLVFTKSFEADWAEVVGA